MWGLNLYSVFDVLGNPGQITEFHAPLEQKKSKIMLPYLAGRVIRR